MTSLKATSYRTLELCLNATVEIMHRNVMAC